MSKISSRSNKSFAGHPQSEHLPSDVLALALERAPAALAILDRDLRYLLSSARWSQDFGLPPPHALVGANHLDLFPSLPEGFRDAHRRCLAGSIECCEERRFMCPDGRAVWARWELRPWLIADGEIDGVMISAETITEHVHVQEELLRREESLRLAVNTSRIGTWHWNLRNNELVWSDLCREMLGMPGSVSPSYELFLDLLHPDDRQTVDAAVRSALDDAHEYETEYRHFWPDGSMRWMRAKGRAYYDPDGRPLRMEGVVLDITPQKQNERALRDSVQRFRSLAEGMPHLLWQLDAEGKIIYANQGWMSYFGRRTIDLFEWGDVVHPEDLPRVWGAWPDMSRGEVNIEPIRLRRHDGVYRWFGCRSVPAYDDSGALLHIIGISTDVDELKRVEEALRLSQARLSAALGAAGMGTWVWDIDANCVTWDDSMLQLFGVEAGPGSFEEFKELLICADDRVALEAAIRRALDENTDFEAEYRIRGPDQKVRWIAAKGRLQKDGFRGPRRLIGASVDVTQHRRLEDELRQAQKMEAIGQLAGGVAHDFNNLLTVIMGQVSLARFTPGLPPRALASIDDIASAAERAASLTAQLLAFGRRQVMDTRDLELNGMVLGVTSMLERLLGEHVSMTFEPSLERLCVHADSNMMVQVLLNLAINARDAMPDGGRLALRVRAVQLDEQTAVRAPDHALRHYACLSVSDTGAGIPAEVLPHIFEPFFTTKELGKGTGLGLATAYGIVRQHRGFIDVVSSPGSGTTLEVYLPRVVGHERTESKPLLEPEPRGRGELILVVEDEERVREVVRTILLDHGYHTVAVANSQQAFDACRECGRDIQLLLTDVVMPDSLPGYELAARLQADKPEIRIILCSGYSESNVAAAMGSLRRALFLPKPYRPEELLRAVRQMLDAE